VIRKWGRVWLCCAAPAWAAAAGFVERPWARPPEREVSAAAPTGGRVTYRQAAAAPAPEPAENLQVGVRATASRLRDSREEFFLGHINELEEHSNLLPYKLYLDWFFLPDWGLELTFDRLRVRTWNEPSGAGGEQVSDGSLRLNELLALLLWRYRNDTAWTPYAGVGLVLVAAGFDHATWWHYGYSSPQEWEDLGKPAEPFRGKTRQLDPSDAVGFVLAGGCKRRLANGWSLDATLRYTQVDVDLHYTLEFGGQVRDKGTRSVPLDHLTLGLGLEYAF